MTKYVKVYEGVLPPEFCEHLIHKFKEQGAYELRRQEGHMIFDEVNICAAGWSEHNVLYTRMQQVVQHYKKSAGILPYQWPDQFGWEELRMKMYNPNEGVFNDHVDVGNYASARRFLSMLIYLNDVEEGGETTFYTSEGSFKIKAKQGQVLVFPPLWMYPHKGEVPVSGEKYIMSTYLHYL